VCWTKLSVFKRTLNYPIVSYMFTVRWCMHRPLKKSGLVKIVHWLIESSEMYTLRLVISPCTHCVHGSVPKRDEATRYNNQQSHVLHQFVCTSRMSSQTVEADIQTAQFLSPHRRRRPDAWWMGWIYRVVAANVCMQRKSRLLLRAWWSTKSKPTSFVTSKRHRIRPIFAITAITQW